MSFELPKGTLLLDQAIREKGCEIDIEDNPRGKWEQLYRTADGKLWAADILDERVDWVNVTHLVGVMPQR